MFRSPNSQELAFWRWYIATSANRQYHSTAKTSPSSWKKPVTDLDEVRTRSHTLKKIELKPVSLSQQSEMRGGGGDLLRKWNVVDVTAYPTFLQRK